MACVEARAFKSSLGVKFAIESSNPALEESLYGMNAVSYEDFQVEEFLNFSCGELERGSVAEMEENEEELETYNILSDSSRDSVDDFANSNSTSFTAAGESDSLLDVELAVPDDNLADLEWVSHFVDDSLSEFPLLYPVGKTKIETPVERRFETETKPVLLGASCFQSPIPARPRTKTKRPRTSGRVWSLGSPLTESSTSSSSSSTSSGFSSPPCLIFTNISPNTELVHSLSEPPAKKQKKKPATELGGSASGAQLQRRCSHCQVQKTPQWRTGPLGAKTLCNACGVRYKSGRLFPEYRPACSPTFSGDIHSNSHRKVLEMRKRKETSGPDAGMTQMVQSF